MSAALVVTLLAAAPGATEQTAWHTVVDRFETVGRNTPVRDPALDTAAKTLAALALDRTAAQAAELLTLTQAVSESGGWDPTPRALVLKGEPAGEPLQALAKHEQLTSEPASHAGLAVATKGEVTAIVVLLADRRIELQRFPRAFAKPPKVPLELCGRLLFPLTSATAFVTRPNGAVESAPVTMRGEQHCAQFSLPSLGRHVVELLGRGDRGPQVAALFFVQVGPPDAPESIARLKEPATPQAAAKAVAGRINELRRAHGSQPLQRDPELDTVAQRYAERLATENFFAHVSPDGQDLKGRLSAAGYGWTAAGENLGLASGPLAAHFSIEHSPGHRKNLLDPSYTHLGLGLARNGQNQLLLVEVLATPTPASKLGPVEAAYEALAAGRRAKNLPPVTRDVSLEALAQTWASRALQADTPRSTLDGERLHDRVFASREDLTTATVDFFVADAPGAVKDSKNAADPQHQLVGIGLVQGDSAKFGAGRYWVAVIYASRRPR